MHRILPLLVLLPTLGCPFGGEMCTAIGCQDFYEMTVTGEGGADVGAFEVSAIIDGEPWDAACPAGEAPYAGEIGCGGGLIMFPYTESPIDISVVTSDGLLGWSGTIELEYEALYPNGEDCDPICHQGNGFLILSEM
jgi:hypothetical protein